MSGSCPSAGCSAPTTRRRCSSGSRSPTDQYLQLDDVVVSERDAARPRASRSGSRASSPRCGPGTRAPASTPTCSSSPTACCRPRSSEAAEITHHPGRARGVRAAAAGRRGPPGRRRRARPGALLRPDGAQAPDRPRPRRRAAYANLDFLDGTRGAHVYISGISGVATKTSYATFLLYSLFNSGVLGDDATNTHGADLQREGRGPALPRPRQHPARRPSSATAYAHARARARARSSRSCVFAPPRKGDPTGTPDVASRDQGVDCFYWTLAEFCDDELLPFVFADADDDRQQYTMVVHNVAAAPEALRRAGRRRRVADRGPDARARTTTSSTSSSRR